MKIKPLLATALLAATSTACKAEKSNGQLLASVRSASHPRAEILDRMTLEQQEQLLGPPLAKAKRVRALVAPSDLTLGPVDAPVVLLAFVDFGVDDGDAVGALLDVQRAHSVDVRIAVRPILGREPASAEANRAVIAAAAQGKGWEVAECVSRPGTLESPLGIGGCTASVGLDMTRYAADVALADARLAENTQAGARLAVTRGPTLFLNGYRIKGVPPMDVLERGVKSTIAHAWQVAGAERLERAQIYPQLMRTASIPPPPVPGAEEHDGQDHEQDELN